MKQEIRSYTGEHSIDGNGTLSGYAAVYNSKSRLITEGNRSFHEYVRPGAFDRSLAENNDIMITFNHGEKFLGRTSSGTGKVWSDSKGLRYQVQLPNYAADIREMIDRNDLTGCSFAFQVVQDAWPSNIKRELMELRLLELGPVLMPAYPRAEIIGVRSLNYLKHKLRLWDRLLK